MGGGGGRHHQIEGLRRLKNALYQTCIEIIVARTSRDSKSLNLHIRRAVVTVCRQVNSEMAYELLGANFWLLPLSLRLHMMTAKALPLSSHSQFSFRFQILSPTFKTELPAAHTITQVRRQHGRPA